jgi:phosphatidylglycerophosphatase A
VVSLRLSDPGHLLALGFGAGLSPRAPGTAGTVAAVPVYLAASTLPTAAYVALCGVLFLLGVWLCGRAARALGTHDDPAIVLDEILGFLVTMVALPASAGWIAAGFVLFRAFDILKPWPVSLLDRRVHGGLGIMLDDLAAGLMALAVLHGARVLWP